MILPVNKRKIINDPVHGFISFPYDIVFDLVEHPYFQRLRRIKQLGLTNYVYPGTNHTRFQHALGATYLMESAIRAIRSKGHEISEEEAEAVTIAILLHDIGHGPFSHTLEESLIEGIDHEEISLLYMQELNMQFNGKLELAINIFKNNYSKKFLHQLVSSQLDMDRLDYLKRDSFFSGVTEGVIGSDRIIKMLNVQGDQLVVDIKGIYSIEKFLVARRLMYWQVYFHKTTIAAENLLLLILKRARDLTFQGEKLFATPSLAYFLENRLTRDDFFRIEKAVPKAMGNQHNGNAGKGGLPTWRAEYYRQNEILEHFSRLDDNDIISAIKVWSAHKDQVLSGLCYMLINRHLFRTVVKNEDFSEQEFKAIKECIKETYNISEEEASYFIVKGEISNFAYNSLDDKIKILLKNGSTQDITEASDMMNVAVLSKTVRKFFLCYPKDIMEKKGINS